MRTRAAIAPLVLATGLAAAPVAAEEADAPRLLDLVRSLSRVQDKVITGDREALAMQSRLLPLADERLGSVPPSQMIQSEQIRALISYGLSGGNPRTVSQQLRALDESDSMAVLGRGLVAYMSGLHEEAVDDLGPIDPMALDSELGAPLALLQGSLYAPEEPVKALRYFDKARLIAPGTIVEEAALRRSIAVLARLKDTTRFLVTARRYAQRFIQSPYADQFAVHFVNGVVELHGQFDLEAIGEISAVMPEDYGRAIFVRIARKAAVNGLAEMSAFAAAQASKKNDVEASLNAADTMRLRFYGLLSTITSDEPGAVSEKLASIDKASLSPQDRDLLKAGQAMAKALVSKKDAPLPAEAPVGQASHMMADVEENSPHAATDGGDHQSGDQAETAAMDDDFSALDSRIAQWKALVEQADTVLAKGGT